jgi:hypothetical protein
MFGTPDQNYVSLVQTQTADIPQISQEEKYILIAKFTEKEAFPLNSTKPFGKLLKLT